MELLCVACVVFFVVGLWRGRRRKRDPLDDVLGWWGKHDPLIVRDLLRSVCVFGQVGSGKSSGSGLFLARAIVKYRNSGGLVLCSKPEDREWWERIFRDAGRGDDLLIMEPGGENRCNVLEYERSVGADTRDLTQFIITMAETLNRAGGKPEDTFWVEQQRRMIYNAIEIVRMATRKLDPWDLQAFITGAANTPAELAHPDSIDVKDPTDYAAEQAKAKLQAFRDGFHYKCLMAARQMARTEIEKHDNKLAYQYFVIELPKLNERTRSSIMAGVMGILHVFNTGIVRDMLATGTNISPAMMEQRKWVMVNMPIVAGDASATFVNASVKYLVQRHILRRKASQTDPIMPIYCDEFPKVANSYDTAYLAEARSHKGCLITLAQSMPGMCEALGGDKYRASALLCNQFIKIFHICGDADTAAFGSGLLGNERKTKIGGSEPAGATPGGTMFGETRMSASFSEAMEPVLEPAAFLGGMRCGGKEGKVDGILIRGGFYRYVEFDQK